MMVEKPDDWKIVATATNQYITEKGSEYKPDRHRWETGLDEGFVNIDNWRMLNQP